MINKFLRTLPLGIAGLLTLVALAYLSSKTVFLQQDAVDYKYIWLAGHIWGMGENPYSTLFGQLGEEIFVGTNRPRTLFYPPNWWPIAVPFSWLPYDLSSVLWRLANGLAILGGSVLATRTFVSTVRPLSLLSQSVILTYACLMSATATNLAIGQVAALAFLGCACFLAAYLKENRALMVLALVLLALKPHMGIVIWAFLVIIPFWWRSIIIAAAIVLAMCLPTFLISGVLPVLQSYMEGLSAHGVLDINSPPGMTGLRNLGYYLAGLDLPVIGLALTGSALAMGLALFAPRTTCAAVILSVLFSILLVFVPLHNYDTIIFALLLLLAFALSKRLWMVACLTLALAFRPNNLAALTKFFDPDVLWFMGARYISMSAAALLVIFLIALLAPQAQTKTGSDQA